jgi:hypothetical protein
MRGHVDAESLALYAEGELSRGRTTRVRAHLSTCPDCAATLAALAEVTTQLSHVPAPSMPSAVAARLDAALSAEVAHRAAGPAPAPAPSPQPPRRNPRWSPATLRILAGTAVALVAAGGIGYAVSQAGSGTASSASAPAGQSAHRSAAQAAPNISAGATGGHAKKPHAGPYIQTSTTRWVKTGTDYWRRTLGAQARQVLAEYGQSGLNGPALVPAGSVPQQAQNCASQTAHGRQVRVVDLARYQRHPAYIIMLGNPDTAVAVSHACVTLHSAQLTVRG